MRPDQVIAAIGLHLVNLCQLLLQVIGGEERGEKVLGTPNQCQQVRGLHKIIIFRLYTNFLTTFRTTSFFLKTPSFSKLIYVVC